MRCRISLVVALLLLAPPCLAVLDANGNFEQKFNDGKCFEDETAGNYTVKWCPENHHYDKKNGNPEGSLTVETSASGNPGTRLWYVFDGTNSQPVKLHVEFDYSNFGGDKDHTPTTGRAESRTSTTNTFNCPKKGWKKQRELSTTWKAGELPQYQTESFDVEIRPSDKSVYIQFIKPRPRGNQGVVMVIDNIKITPQFQKAGQSVTKPVGK
jgi:hypothetical protein